MSPHNNDLPFIKPSVPSRDTDADCVSVCDPQDSDTIDTLGDDSIHGECTRYGSALTVGDAGGSQDADENVISCTTLHLLPGALASLLRKVGQSLNRDCGIHCRRDGGGPGGDVGGVGVHELEQSRHVKGSMVAGSSVAEMTAASNKEKRNLRKTDPRVKNIYRKPVCRLANRNRSNSCQRFGSNSLAGSCKLRRTVSSVSGGTAHYGHEARGGGHDRNLVIGRDNDVITRDNQERTHRGGAEAGTGSEADAAASMEDVFRQRSCSLPDIPPSILKNRGQEFGTERCLSESADGGGGGGKNGGGGSAGCKRASFKEKVDVYCYTTKDIPIASPVTEKRSRQHEEAKNSNTSRKSDARTGHGCHGGKRDDIRRDGLIRCIENNVVPCVDAQGATYRRLHMRITIDDSCIRDKTTVKAFSGGRAVVVFLYPKLTSHTGEHLESKLPLPLQIDPYSVRARVHKDGILTISANIPHVPLKSVELEEDQI